ncbi:hypothetical protein BFF78_25995 [Streptomyces fodineus]|uniref:Secreted protein n=1 Tax=Streptomyces fodineus TaxID=1904616 RepID=A0A1D7YEK9_9ACTN|nr:hypothetical protein [Streptomyces fodineus]AOR34045.1 hypothetical protein BFF78_25995 [Streptomyces fodineus]
MTPSRLLRRGPAAAAAAVGLTAALTTGCGAAHRALDCARTANAVADDVDNLQQAARDAAFEPSKAGTYFDPIQKDLKEIGDQRHNVDVDKAVHDLDKAVGNVRTSVQDGDKTPDLGPVGDAAGELTKACTR